MPNRTRLVIGLCILTAVLVVAYWVCFFFVPGSVQSSSEAWYLIFERSFVLADGWIVFCAVACAVALLKKKQTGLLWGLLGASSLLYLGCMDVLFDLENGMYAHMSADVVTEAVINVLCLAGGTVGAIWFWRQRGTLLALQR